ncbi:hypothetical protein HZC31_02985 [Candidatus Woesearchaeota archaeon]|nr:hypothetical protein [Candidatus Woesearchaeota archaeon]
MLLHLEGKVSWGESGRNILHIAVKSTEVQRKKQYFSQNEKLYKVNNKETQVKNKNE